MPLLEDLQRLNERASQLYEKKDYSGAKRLWEEVLKIDPSDQRAKEGIRMATILSEQWSPLDEAAPVNDETAQRIDAIVDELQAGRVVEAMMAAQNLLTDHPEDSRVAQIHASALRAYEAEPFIREHLDRARGLIAAGNLDDARACCRKVLALDEGNHEGHELFHEIERAQSPRAANRPAGQGTRQAPSGLVATSVGRGQGGGSQPMSLVFEHRPENEPESAEAAPTMTRAPESASGGLFEMPGEPEVLDLATDGLDLDALDAEVQNVVTSESPASPAPSSMNIAENASEGEGPFFDAAVPSGASQASSLSDLPLNDAPQTNSRPKAENPQIAALVYQARTELDAGNFDNAIVSASRALAIDPNDEEASEVIDRARDHVEKQIQEIDSLMLEVHRCADHGDTAAAERLLRDVLKIRPEHREARSILEKLLAGPPSPEAGSQTIALGGKNAPSADKSDPEALAVSTSPGTLQIVKPHPATAGAARTSAPAPLLKAQPQRGSVFAGLSMTKGLGGSKGSIGRLIMLAVALVVVLGGWLVFRTFFGSAEASASNSSISAPAPPQKLKAPGAAGSAASQDKSGPSTIGGVSIRGLSSTELVRIGRRAMIAGHTDDAVTALRAAVASNAENTEAVSLLRAATERQAEEQSRQKEMAEVLDAFREKRYDDALRALYRLPEQQQQKGEIELYKRNAWYNLGVDCLQSGDRRGAIQKFDEVLLIDARDSQAIEARKIAQAYVDRAVDRSYTQFVSALALRKIDAR